jgi:hypothetical protein
VAPAKKSSKAEYLSGEPPQTAKVSEIESSLQRGASPIQAYFVLGTLITEPLVVARERELSKRNMEATEVTKSNIAKRKSDVVVGKTCFEVKMTSHAGNMAGIEVADLGNWKIKAEQPSGVFTDLVFKVKGTPESPKLAGTQLAMMAGLAGAYGVETVERSRVSNNIVCSTNQLDLLQTLKVHFIPQFGDEKFKSATLEWAGVTVRTPSGR